MGLRRASAALLFLTAIMPYRYRLTAQENPVLRAAAALAAEGRGDSARRMVARELGRLTPGTDGFAEALYWRARLAVSGDSAERDLRRVAIEYSNSPWADEALLQLSQLALAAANPAGALQLAQRLRSDYPGSELRPRAALWAARASFDVGETRSACAWLDTAAAEAGGDVEFLNQVSFYRARCAAVAPASAARRPAPAETVAPTPPAPAAPAAPGRLGAPQQWLVQAAAVRTDEEAQRLRQRLERAGFAARIERGADGFRRVRVGPFDSREAASGARLRLRRLLGGSPFIVPEP